MYTPNLNIRSLVKFVGVSWVYDKNGDRVSKNDKSYHICSMRLKKVLEKLENYETLSIYISNNASWFYNFYSEKWQDLCRSQVRLVY